MLGLNNRRHPMRPALIVLTAISLSSLPACTQAGKTGAAGQTPAPVVVVNGVTISELDIEIALRQGKHTAEMTPESRANTIETLIRQELIRQRARKLGLENDEQIQPRLALIAAQQLAAERALLGDAFFRKEVATKATVSDEEAQKYFEENFDKLATEFHIFQILYKNDEASAVAARMALDSGKTFEEVAAQRFANLPPSHSTPWDLGFLHWTQMPAEWRPIVSSMEKGAVSEIIRGTGNRTWILKLVDKRRNDLLDFNAEKPVIGEFLRGGKMEEIREKAVQDLRNSAKIVYAKSTQPKPAPEN